MELDAPDPWTWWSQDPEIQDLLGIKSTSSKSTSSTTPPGQIQEPVQNPRPEVIQCRYCRRPFPDSEATLSRVREHEAACGKLRCSHCCSFFRTALETQGHVRVCPSNALFRCQFCTKRYHGGQAVREHEATCELNPKLSCEHCGRFFGHESIRKKHVPRCPHHPHRVCTFCKLRCPSRAETVVHEVFCTANPSTKAQQSTCVACDQVKQCLSFPCREHSYCASCIRQMVKLGFKDRQLLPLRCCKSYVVSGDPIDLAVAQMLSETAKAKYQEVMMLQAATSVMYCPRPSCGVLIILDDLLSAEGIKAARFGFFADRAADSEISGPVGCPKCEQALCFQCRSEWHTGMNCAQYQWTVSKYADEITKFCRKMNWMRCFDCGHVIEKKAGCNHITCFCGSQFCYLCGSKWGHCRCEIFDQGHALRHNRAPAAGALQECRYCHQQLPSAVELRVHLSVCQTALAARGGTFVCNNCQARFMDAVEYRRHRRECFANAALGAALAVPDVDVSRFG
mmetsp:Transcript_96571/g.171692  ORF Transcript_96571/g.171692 Transcript_96571/m.171692 type:complete len:510 (-) Transcript_96571:295-1824(-)|eukprot:CAMPEP_0197657284 /NCGR_PEP_ID=MMETSP1338-20131121/44537_1 /TAXON_ID=43686 ORGANISM="Pelagodinium beii, Strain RCC1491" /NCGR_SAMPLE_ID=MMETSP1338 /ASSEMBLY_ACC=CAM_ASM_000754 /LENGTH=509 /DNA_ID=CAMNT_0043233623 /DNA_START=128 /DNA_END=1657 /DNA_ORIENTATION=+